MSQSVVTSLQRKPSDRDRSARAGMILFLSAWGMMLGALLFTFLFVRTSAEVWPPSETPALPTLWPALASGLLLASSALVELGRRAIKRNRSGLLAASWLGAALVGAGFVALQSVMFVTSRSLGLKGSFGALLLMFVLFHTAHALAGLPGLLVVASRARSGRYGALQHTGVSLWALYWYFATTTWVLLCLTVFWL